MLLGILIDTGEHAKKVCFEGADHAFGNVALVHVRRYLLVVAFQLVGDAVNVGGLASLSSTWRSTESPRAFMRSMMALYAGIRCL